MNEVYRKDSHQGNKTPEWNKLEYPSLIPSFKHLLSFHTLSVISFHPLSHLFS